MRKEYCVPLPAISLFLALIASFCMQTQLKGQYYLSPDLLQKINGFKKESRFGEALVLLDSQLVVLKTGTDNKSVVEAELLKADIYRMQGHNDKAEKTTDSLLIFYSPVFSSCEILQAQLSTIRGTIHLTVGKLSKGRSEIETAIRIYRQTMGQDDTILGPCYNKLGNYFYFSKSFDSAMIYYTKALDLAEMKLNSVEDRASYIQNKGIIHLEQGDYSQAENCFLESLSLKESVYPPFSYSLGRIYLNIGKFYQSISALDKALLFLGKGEKIFCATGVPANIELGKIYWNKGLILYLLGDYDMAITYLFNARQIIDSVFTDNKQLMASLNSDIGNVYKSSGQYNKAIKHYNLSLSGDNFQYNIKTCRNLANLYFLEGDHQKAGFYYQKLLSENMDPGHQDSPEDALTFLHYGDFLTELGDDRALIYLNKAYEIFSLNKGLNARDVAATLFSIGSYYSKKEEFFKALKFDQQSLISISGSFTDTNVLNNPPLQSLSADNLVIKILSNKARNLNKNYSSTRDAVFLVASGNTYLLCMDIIDQLRMSYRSEYSQLLLTDDLHRIYHEAIEQFLFNHNITGDDKWLELAFQTSERGKSMILLKEFKDANAKKIGIIPEEMGIREKEIKKYLYLYRNQIWEVENQDEPDLNKLNYLRASLLIYEQKYDSLTGYLKKNYPGYFKLKYDNTVVSIGKLQKFLDNDEVVIEYTLSDENIYLFLITPDDFEVKEIGIDSCLVKEIFGLRTNLDFNHVAEYNQDDYLKYQLMAYNLYKKLIQPVESYLEGKKLTIIPDGELNYLSFESLIENISFSDTISFRNLPYLIKKCPVTYAASATILSIIKKGDDPELTTGVLALAPSFNLFTRSFLTGKGSTAAYMPSKMDLPGATWEVETILKIMAGKQLIGEQATETEFKKLASSFDILHFATHTRIDDENPLSSTMSLYPFDLSGEDGILNTYEIYGLDLKGELAVLSACSTGNGKLQKGEGVISLARAFTYAGMPSVVMTLWDVDDISSGNILPSFYQMLVEGNDKDAALRFAKLNYLEKTKSEIETHPAFWSGIVLYGNNRGFRKQDNQKYLISLAVLGCLLIFVSLILLKKYFNFRNNLRRIDIDPPTEFRAEDRF
jgi:CHAT domain-containing protein/tetratricopeptide (TPR) repeat protein